MDPGSGDEEAVLGISLGVEWPPGLGRELPAGVPFSGPFPGSDRPALRAAHSPAPGSYSRSRRETTVDLPEPLGPTSAVTDPAGMERLKSRNTGTSGRVG